MKKIVMACKNITEDVESHETDRTPDISRIKTDLSISLTQLMTSAKAHATSSTSATVNDIERTSERVTEIIVQLVNSITTSDDSVAEGANRTDQVMANYMPRDVYSPMTTKDPAKSTLELKSFLEMQTDTIVQSIQSLLNAMRQPGPYGRDFLAIVGDISDVVNAVITESKGTLANTEFGDKAGVILVDLVKVLKQLEGLGQEMVNVSPSKSLKQKMASSSYEIAKYVKELLNVLD